MSFQERNEKHKNFIQERWLPLSVKVMLEKDPKNKISIIRAAQKQAAKEIQDIEVQSTFIEFLEWEIKYLQGPLNQEGSASTQANQRNETLNTGESHSTGEPVEKIDWEAGLAELAFMFEILFKNEEIGCSMKQYKKSVGP